MLKMMYDSDFTERKSIKVGDFVLDMDEVSSEDLKFMKLMSDEVTKVGTHYQFTVY